MTRLATPVAELGLGLASAGGVVTGTVTRDTAITRTGTSSYKADSTAGNVASSIQWTAPFVLGQATIGRVYFRFDTFPTATLVVLRFAGTVYPTLRLKTTGKLALFDPAGTQIGSDSAATVVLGRWYMLELSTTIGTGATDAAEARLDGVSIASASGQTWSDVLPTVLNAGWISGPGANRVLYMDDAAINDTSGAAQNSWPGPGRVVVLFPASVSAQGSWTIGAGGSIPTALSNSPPLGVADNVNSTVQARSISITANDALSVVTEPYSAKVPSGATVTLVQPFVDHSEGAGAATKNLDLAVTANPVGTTSAAFTAGGDSGAAGTWPANWRGAFGPAVVAPSLTLGTGATLRVRDVTTTNAAVLIDQMALIVEFTGGGVAIHRAGGAVADATAAGARRMTRSRRGGATADGTGGGSRRAARHRHGGAAADGTGGGSRRADRHRSGGAAAEAVGGGSQRIFVPPPPGVEIHRSGGATASGVGGGSRRVVAGLPIPPGPPSTGGGAGGGPGRVERSEQGGFVRRAGVIIERSGGAAATGLGGGSRRVHRYDPEVEVLLLAGMLE